MHLTAPNNIIGTFSRCIDGCVMIEYDMKPKKNGSKGERQMRIMSFNVLCYGSGKHDWTKRIPLVVRTIRNCNPDTFGVQEAHYDWMRALIAAFPDYDYVGVGRDNGKKRGEFSAVFYKKDEFEVIDKGNFWLSETPEKPGSKGWDAACIRICSWAKLRRKKDGKEFVHLNTHLDHIGEVAMQKGAELVAERGTEIAAGAPAFFTGDFNVTPDSAPCRAVKACGFKDARDMTDRTDMGDTYHAFEDPNAPHSVIDYVFCKGDITVKQFKVVRKHIDGEIPSDHYPVFADVNF